MGHAAVLLSLVPKSLVRLQGHMITRVWLPHLSTSAAAVTDLTVLKRSVALMTMDPLMLSANHHILEEHAKTGAIQFARV